MTEMSQMWATGEPTLALTVTGLTLTILLVIAHAQLWRAAVLTGAGVGLLVLGTMLPG